VRIIATRSQPGDRAASAPLDAPPREATDLEPGLSRDLVRRVAARASSRHDAHVLPVLGDSDSPLVRASLDAYFKEAKNDGARSSGCFVSPPRGHRTSRLRRAGD